MKTWKIVKPDYYIDTGVRFEVSTVKEALRLLNNFHLLPSWMEADIQIDKINKYQIAINPTYEKNKTEKTRFLGSTVSPKLSKQEFYRIITSVTKTSCSENGDSLKKFFVCDSAITDDLKPRMTIEAKSIADAIKPFIEEAVKLNPNTTFSIKKNGSDYGIIAHAFRTNREYYAEVVRFFDEDNKWCKKNMCKYPLLKCHIHQYVEACLYRALTLGFEEDKKNRNKFISEWRRLNA